ncbi:MAG: peptidoglycan-associated lipoprotein Pal [Maricaulaceae bacterium]|jgi:peptidoglycan-associated lipoprotein
MKLKLLGAVVAALAVSACASTTAEDMPTTPPEVRETGPAAGSAAEFQAQAGDSVFFAFDSHALSSEARSTLDRQAAWLQTYSNTRVRVEGNCDERGTREYNLALGERRASAARDYLVSRGVDPSRITVVSYGKERPRDPRSNEAAWAVNRNAQTVVLNAVGS